MKEFMYFRNAAVQLMTEVTYSLLPLVKKQSAFSEPDQFLSDDLMMMLAKFLDLFVELDSIKTLKVSMNNDLSSYKRYPLNFIFYSFQ